MRGFSRSIDESKDVARAGDTVASIQKQQADLRDEFNTEISTLEARIDPSTESLETITIKPNKSDIMVQLVSLVWAPYWQDGQGINIPAW